MLKLHLDTINVDPSTNYPDDHALILLIADFAGIICDRACLEIAPLANVKLVWSAARRILDWIQRQKSKVHGFLAVNSCVLNGRYVYPADFNC